MGDAQAPNLREEQLGSLTDKTRVSDKPRWGAELHQEIAGLVDTFHIDALERLRQRLEGFVEYADRIGFRCAGVLFPFAKHERVVDHHPAPRVAACHERVQDSR